MLGLKLNHVSKRGYRSRTHHGIFDTKCHDLFPVDESFSGKIERRELVGNPVVEDGTFQARPSIMK